MKFFLFFLFVGLLRLLVMVVFGMCFEIVKFVLFVCCFGDVVYVVYMGQYYDYGMFCVFLQFCGIGCVDFQLYVGGFL